MNKIKILYIDDEQENLNAFKASFRRTFDIYLANSAEEGIAVLKSTSIEVVIADQRMPTTTGIDFFESIINEYPNPIRILLTGYTDIDAVVDAINKGQVYRYITKPWNEHDLKMTIESAYHLYSLREQNSKLNVKYKRVFDESSDPIILFDKKGRIIGYNKATLGLFNYLKHELNFTLFTSLIKNKNDAQFLIDSIKNDQYIRDFECQVICNDKEVKECLISVNQICDNYGDIISYQAIIKDVTARSRINKLLLKTIIDTQEDERERISKDLHDGLGQHLAAIKLHLETLKDSYKINDTETQEEFENVFNLLGNSIIELRRICTDTLPRVLHDFGLIKAIEETCRKTASDNFVINFEYSPSFPILNKALEIAIFRIIQEFINNTLKHGKAKKMLIDIRSNKGHVILHIKDDGVGFDMKDPKYVKGHGLKNIRTRIESFDGNVRLNSIINKGTELDVSIPILMN